MPNFPSVRLFGRRPPEEPDDINDIALADRERLVRKYFSLGPEKRNIRPTATLGAGSIAAFVAAIALGGAMATAGTFVGLVLLAASAVKYRSDNKGFRYEIGLHGKTSATPVQMDAWRQAGVDEIIEAGYRRLHIHRPDLAGTRPDAPGAKPLVVYGVPNRDRFDVRFKEGKDGVTRSSFWEVMVIYLTEWHLCAYKTVLQMTTGFTITDNTWEFHYEDVVSVSTRSDRIRIPHSAIARPGLAERRAAEGKALHVTGEQHFEIRVPGDRVSMLIAVNDEQAVGTDDDDSYEQSGLDTALQQIRKKLNDYKNRRDPGPTLGLNKF